MEMEQYNMQRKKITVKLTRVWKPRKLTFDTERMCCSFDRVLMLQGHTSSRSTTMMKKCANTAIMGKQYFELFHDCNV